MSDFWRHFVLGFVPAVLPGYLLFLAALVYARSRSPSQGPVREPTEDEKQELRLLTRRPTKYV